MKVNWSVVSIVAALAGQAVGVVWFTVGSFADSKVATVNLQRDISEIKSDISDLSTSVDRINNKLFFSIGAN